MVETIEAANSEAWTVNAPATDRRRPGRRDFENPALIGLLRQAPDRETPTVDTIHDDLRAARGIATGVAVSLLLSGATGLLTWWALG